LARALLERGLLSLEEFEDARAVRNATGRPLMGILVEKAYLSPAQLQDAVAALQSRVRFCTRCNVRVPSPQVLDGKERCPRCLFEVRWQEERKLAQIQDFESIVRLTRDELPPDVQAARRVPGRVFGKYILVDEIGRGGEGVVRKAWDTMLGEYVALKFIRERHRPGERETAVRRSQIFDLLLEARAAMRLRHEHIVPVRDVGRIDDQFFIAMDYIEGETLAVHLRDAQEKGRLSPLYEKPALYLRHLRDVSNAIHFAHGFSRPIIHCDLKPGNVLVSRAGAAYVLDFGLARVIGGPSSDEDMVRGTPAYMAPEQVRGRMEDLGVWTDVYGLGAILYELMAGRPVFTGEPVDILRHGLRDAPQRPLDLLWTAGDARPPESGGILPELTKLEMVCLRCLAKNPKERYPTARAVAEELQTIVEAIEAGREGTFVPPRVLEAQQRSELRRVDEQISSLAVESALREWETVRRKREDPQVRRRLADQRHQLFLLDQFRARLVERLNARRPTLPGIALEDGALELVEVLKATSQRLILFSNDQARDVPWSSVPPSEVAAIAERIGLNEPADRLALGILCRHAGRPEVAERYLRSLEGTVLADLARDILEQKE
jgi:serine/threonine protein kinase